MRLLLIEDDKVLADGVMRSLRIATLSNVLPTWRSLKEVCAPTPVRMRTRNS